MKIKLLLILSLFLFFQNINGQTFDTITICNGDSAYIFNNWETVTGNYSTSTGVTTLIVNPTPTLTGNFILNGNAAQPIPNTYQLTQASNGQSGSAWNSVTLNLTQPFSFDVDMFFGFNNGGADGIAFLLQQVNTNVGTGGGGIGYQGIMPSFCVEFDTWQNGTINADPWYDHLAVQKNGDLNHSSPNNLVSPIGFPPGNINIEDGQWHNVVFSWDPSTFNFSVVFDGTLLVNYNNNIVANIFGNTPYVYWGFTAATGGANNLQQFRVNSLGAQLSDYTICQDDTVQINPQINTPLYTYLWLPNYNITNNTASTTSFSPDTTTVYSLEITNSYGCFSTDSLTIFVNAPTSTDNVGTHCDTYTWLDGVTYTASNNSATWTITDPITGCIHTEILNLIINNSTTSTYNAGTHCDTYTWIDGITYTVSNSTATWITTNATGCDNVETLNLTINNSTSNTTPINACDTYTWSVNNQTYTSNGTYTDISTNAAGCTHTEILDLVVGYTDDIDLLIEETNISCFGYDDGSIILNAIGGTPPYQFLWDNGSTNQGIISLSAGSYPFTITDLNGCTIDSVAIIEEAKQVFLDFIATSPICRYDESTLSIHISNSNFNSYTVSLQDSILKSYTIDTNGLLIATGLPIILTPNFSCNPVIISLTDENGCTAVVNDNVHIEVKQLPVLAVNEPDICIGTPSFTLVNATPTGGSYKIEGVSTDFFDASNLNPGNYNISYSYTDPITSCSNQTTEILTISESPRAGMIFSPQPANISDPNIFFRDNSNEEVLISEWDLGDGTIIYDDLSFWHTYNDIGSYTIRYYITNLYGCTDSVVKQLNINPNYSTFIPNSFTPNNDGDNDIFYPVSTGFNSYNMKIFDRWGGIIFDEDDLAWDGNTNGKIIGGLYSYSITILDFKDKPFIYTGLVNLIR